MVKALLDHFGEFWLSPVCKTAAVGVAGADYLNAVASMISPLHPQEFEQLCKSIESSLGRVRPSKVCTADIDLLACWDKPAPTSAQYFIEESYYQPQADRVLDSLGLYLDNGEVSDVVDGIKLELPNGMVIGQDTIYLQAA